MRMALQKRGSSQGRPITCSLGGCIVVTGVYSAIIVILSRASTIVDKPPDGKME
jgi:hypothetical protein